MTTRSERRCAWTYIQSSQVKEVRVEWINKFTPSEEDKILYVLPQYEARLRNFLDFAKRFWRTFLLLVTTETIAILVGAIFHNQMLIGASFISMGLTLIIFPFATPITMDLLGVRGSIAIARVTGIGVILLGALELLS